MREVITTREDDLQLKSLRKAYMWYLRKLESIGDLTAEDREESKQHLDPDGVRQAADEITTGKLAK